MTEIFINEWSAWAPGIESREAWESFDFSSPVFSETSAPALPFVPVLFKRRLSTLSRMIIHTIHHVSQDFPPIKITLSSIYGEITRQWKIARKIIESGDVSPAHFSLSVFNTPVALSSILEKNTAGYSAIFSGENAFETGLKDCIAALQASKETERIYAYGDETLPDEYQKLVQKNNPAFSLALRLSKIPASNSIACPLHFSFDPKTSTDFPAFYFLKKEILCKN